MPSASANVRYSARSRSRSRVGRDVRAARRFVPELPARLRPGDGWRGTISAPGSLASGRWVRVVFGPLVAVGDPPDDMRTRFVWITDHAYHLRARP